MKRTIIFLVLGLVFLAACTQAPTAASVPAQTPTPTFSPHWVDETNLVSPELMARFEAASHGKIPVFGLISLYNEADKHSGVQRSYAVAESHGITHGDVAISMNIVVETTGELAIFSYHAWDESLYGRTEGAYYNLGINDIYTLESLIEWIDVFTSDQVLQVTLPSNVPADLQSIQWLTAFNRAHPELLPYDPVKQQLGTRLSDSDGWAVNLVQVMEQPNYVILQYWSVDALEYSVRLYPGNVYEFRDGLVELVSEGANTPYTFVVYEK